MRRKRGSGELKKFLTLFQMVAAIFVRRRPQNFLKVPIEGADGIETASGGDGGDGGVALAEQVTGKVDAVLVDEVGKMHAQMVVQVGGQIVVMIAQIFGQHFEAQRLVEMILNIHKHSFQNVTFLSALQIEQGTIGRKLSDNGIQHRFDLIAINPRRIEHSDAI